MQLKQFPACAITQDDLANIRTLRNQIDRLSELERQLLRSLAEKLRAGAKVEDGILTVKQESKPRNGYVMEAIRIL